MGYDTRFSGEFTIEPPLTDEQQETMHAFLADRHDSSLFPGI